MKRLVILVLALVSVLFTEPALAGEIEDILSSIQTLNIRRNGYTLGGKLTSEQLANAEKSLVKQEYPGTFKFSNKDLFIVAHKPTGRVLIMYERLDPINPARARDIIGSLVFEYGEPTFAAHDKSVFWVFTDAGKVSEEQFMKAKKENRALPILATVKLSSSRKIGELIDKESGLTEGDLKGESLYYIISPSEKTLAQIK